MATLFRTHHFTWLRLLTGVLLGVVVSTATATADSYTVNASIPYLPPTQPAVINPALNGTTVSNALTTITGTCQLMNPQTAVAIWIGAAAVGSTTCDGTFSLQVMLQPGDNVLVAKTTNASGQPGPDSTPVTINLTLPPVLPPPTNNTTLPSSPQSEIVSTNAGAENGLHVETTDAYSVIDNSKNVTLQVVVSGGEHPYDIRLDWGDGSIDIRTVDQPGTYEFTHVYQTAGTFKVHGVVRDVLGAYTEFDHAVISTVKGPTTTTKTKPSAGGTSAKAAWWRNTTWIWLLFPIIVLLLLFGTYWLGWHRADDRWKKRTARKKKSRLLVGAKRRKRKRE